jgi:hypothetical protein
MKWQLAWLACASLVAGAPAMAHHSFAMFDQDNPLDLEGVVQEFKFTNPHTFILLAVKQEDGTTQTWNLEGNSPSTIVRGGWSSKSLKPGDQIRIKIWPLRSGAPGGGWNVDNINFHDEKPIADRPKEN